MRRLALLVPFVAAALIVVFLQSQRGTAQGEPDKPVVEVALAPEAKAESPKAAEAEAGGFLARAKLRVFLRMKARRTDNAAERDAVNKVLDDKDLFDAVLDGTYEQYQSEAASAAPGAVQDWLQFLFDHWEEILKMIMQIISLFSQAGIEISHGDALTMAVEIIRCAA